MMKKIDISFSNEYYMYLLYIYILTIIRFFLHCQFDALEYLYVCIVIYYSSIHVHFYSVNVRYESVVEPIYIDYSFFKCAVEKMYRTAQKTLSNVATCFSPTYRSQIISKYSLLSTSDFS